MPLGAIPLLGLAAAAAGALLFAGRKMDEKHHTSATGRTYTRADLNKLRELMLRKMYAGRELRICLDNQRRTSLMSWGEVLGTVTGMFVALGTMDPQKGLTAARAVASAYDAASRPKSHPCASQMELLGKQIAEHDALSDAMGIAREATYENLQQIVADLGGFTATTVNLQTREVTITYEDGLGRLQFAQVSVSKRMGLLAQARDELARGENTIGTIIDTRGVAHLKE